MKFMLGCVFAFALAAMAEAQSAPLQILAEINLARTAPRDYANLLAVRMAGYEGREGHRAVKEAVRFLERATPLPPLTLSQGMSQAAAAHVSDQGSRGLRGHSGSGGTTPWARMARFGKHLGYAGENLYYGACDARGIVMALIVDDGVRGRGHRKNIFNANFKVTGIAAGPHISHRAMCVMDFASGYVEQESSSIAVRTGDPARSL